MHTDRRAIDFKGPLRVSGGIEEANHVPNGASGGAEFTLASGVSKSWDRLRFPRHVRLVLDGVTVSVLADDDYGGSKILDMPDTNMLLLGAESDLTLVKGNESGGFEIATAVTAGIGTAIASNSTLSGSMVDVISGVALATGSLQPKHEKHTHADGSITYPVNLDDSPTGALYLNVSTSISADDTLTISGTIDLFFIDLGNQTS